MPKIKVKQNGQWVDVASIFTQPYNDVPLKQDIEKFKQDINNQIGTISTALDELNGEVI